MSRGKGRTEALIVDQTRQTTTGSPTGSNAQGDRVPVVAQGLGQCPGHDEGGQVEGSTRVEVARMGDSAFIRRTRHWRAGCTQPCPSGSGGGGWIPLVTGGWPPTSSLRTSAWARLRRRPTRASMVV